MQTDTTKRLTLADIRKMKGKEPVVMITAYDALFAKLFDEQVEMILVGDSLNMSFMGKDDTLSATMDQMIYHTRAVCNGAKRACVVFDMPFGSYTTPQTALQNAVRVYRETCAQIVKIEGDATKAETVRHLSDNGIAVMAHIGLLPQHINATGGYKVRGRTQEDIDALVRDAKALEEAGAAMLLIEGVTLQAAQRIMDAVQLPVIGIGAGNVTDGQVLVWSDMFGFFEAFTPKFAKRYGDGAVMVREGLGEYVKEVKSSAFPDEAHSYT
jgi:3-methyl-2-oxobutanoate hydroxymethyltransferase